MIDPATGVFNKGLARRYDERNSNSPISDGLHASESIKS